MMMVNNYTSDLCDDLPQFRNRNSCQIQSDEFGRLDAVAVVRIIGSSLGFIGSFSIILSVIIRRKLCNTEIQPIFIMSLADCILSGLWISGSSMWLSGFTFNDYNRVYCYPITLLTAIFECVTFNLTLVYAFIAYMWARKTNLQSLLVSIVANHRPVSARWLVPLYTIAWLVPVIMISLVVIITDQLNNFISYTRQCSCWCKPTIINILPFAWFQSDEDSSKRYMEALTTFILALGGVISFQYIIVFIFLIFFYVKIILKIRKLKKECEVRSDASSYGTAAIISKGQSNATRRILSFLTVFVFSGFFNLCSNVVIIPLMSPGLHLMYTKVGKVIYFIFIFSQSLTLPLQGFLNAIVYGWTRDEFLNVPYQITNLNDRVNTEDDESRTLTNSGQFSDSQQSLS